MKIIESPLDAYQLVAHWRQAKNTIGLVPTMGALHAGHLDLVKRSRAECDKTIATIFINPTQFAPHEDLSRYPRTLDDDLRGLEELQTDMVFLPQPDQIYPARFFDLCTAPTGRPAARRGISAGSFSWRDYHRPQAVQHLAGDDRLLWAKRLPTVDRDPTHGGRFELTHLHSRLRNSP